MTGKQVKRDNARVTIMLLGLAGAAIHATALPAAEWVSGAEPLKVEYSTDDPAGLPVAATKAESIAAEAAAGDQPGIGTPQAPPREDVTAEPSARSAPAAVKTLTIKEAKPIPPSTQVSQSGSARATDTKVRSVNDALFRANESSIADSVDSAAEPGDVATATGEGTMTSAGGEVAPAADMTRMPESESATAPAPAPTPVNRQPVAYLPPNVSYLVQPGDILQITVWKEEDLQREVLVRPDGGISFPLSGDIVAAGRTVAQIQQDLSARIESFIPEPVVTVAVKQVVGNRVYVVGRVNKPGEIIMGHELTVMQALSLAGGVTPFAALNKVHVLRRDGGAERSIPFRYADVEKGRNLSQNIVLQNGDVVVVP